jgi:hypothetical protein
MSDRVAFLGVGLTLAIVFAASSGAAAPAAKLNTEAFLAACTSDEVVTGLAGFDEGKVTPKQFCDCVVGKYQDNKLNQNDLDLLTRVHKDELTEADETNASLESLLSSSEGYEDACKKSLGLPVNAEDDEAPAEDDTPGDEEAPPPEGEPD